MNGIQRKRGVCGGRACVEGTGIETHFLIERFLAGDSMTQLSLDYEITLRQVEQAIRFECCRTCKCRECKWARDLKVLR